MVAAHGILAEVVLGLTLIVGIWGVASWLLRRPSVIFWYLLRAAQVAIVLQVAIGGLLLAADRSPGDDLHFLYGVLPLVVMFVTEGMRVGVAAREMGDRDIHDMERAEQRAVAVSIVRRETGIMALGALISFALVLRAAMTAGYF